MDSSKEQRQAQRAWRSLIGLFVLLLGVLVFVLFRDDPPPGDSWMLSRAPQAEASNPWALFRQYFVAHPPEDYRGLWIAAGRDFRQIPTDSLRDYMVRLGDYWEHFDRLMQTDSAGWEGRNLKNEGDSQITRIQRMRIELLVRDEKLASAAAEAIKTARFAKGLFEASHSIDPLQIEEAGRQLEFVLRTPGIGEDILRHVQSELEPLVLTPDLAARILQAHYAWIKQFYGQFADNPSAFSSSRDSFSEKIRDRYLFRKNRTLALFLDFEKPLMAATKRDWASVLREEQHLDTAFKAWRSKISFYVSTNAAGHKLLNFATEYVTARHGAENAARFQLIIAMIALRRFELAEGHLPANLEMLSPKYLAHVPLDPFDNKPLRWDLARQILYSVGLDQVDDHGTFTHEGFILDEDMGMHYWWKAGLSPASK